MDYCSPPEGRPVMHRVILMEPGQQLYLEVPAEGVERFVQRLDLARFIQAGMEITRVTIAGERIILQLDWDGVGSETVIIRRADDQPAFMSTRRLSLSVAGASAGRAWQVLLSRIAVSSGDADIDDLIFVLAGGVPDNMADVADSPINAWGSGDSWSQFFCDHAMARKFYEALQFEDNACFLVHGDLECKFITPRFRATLPRFFNYPWKIFGESEGRDPLTDLTDHDVIYGGEQRLSDHIEGMLSNQAVRGLVIINSTCVPVVIGDDVEKVMEKFRDRCTHGMYHISPQTENPTEIMMQYLDDARERAVREERPDDGSIALVGFRAGRTHGELRNLISEVGIEVKGTILPRASARLMERIMKADVLVFRPNVFMTELYDRVFLDCGRRRILPAPPFGLAATARWLMEIAASVGMEDRAAQVIESRLAGIAGVMEKLRLQAAQYEMTFVADPSSPARLLDPVSATGLAPLPAVAELGYRIRVLARDDFPALYRDFCDRIGTWAAASGVEVQVQGFSDSDSLAAAIASGSGGAVFSEFFYDSRISRHGRHQFSARDFEMGFEGAVRTAQRLLRLAANPFYDRYSGFIATVGSSRNWWKS